MIVELVDRSLLKISGQDASTFLQGQLTNDVSKIDPSSIQVNAFCQHQGKIIALIWLWKNEDTYYISLPIDIKDKFVVNILKYKFFSEIEVEDISNKIKQFGLIGIQMDGAYKITNKLSYLAENISIQADSSLEVWNDACVNEIIPEVFSLTSELFTPQVINLDIDNFGVSFTKGCYPGQEVVARMNYLGVAKRRLFKFKSKHFLSVGDKIYSPNSKSKKSSGIVVRVSKNKDWINFLATFEISHLNDQIFLDNTMEKEVFYIK